MARAGTACLAPPLDPPVPFVYKDHMFIIVNHAPETTDIEHVMGWHITRQVYNAAKVEFFVKLVK